LHTNWVGLTSLALGARGLGKFVNEEKSTLAKFSLPREDTAPSRASIRKEEHERTLLEWWANYDPGIDAYLDTRAVTTSPDSPCEVKVPMFYTSTYCNYLRK
jgi:hypothetical protein